MTGISRRPTTTVSDITLANYNAKQDMQLVPSAGNCEQVTRIWFDFAIENVVRDFSFSYQGHIHVLLTIKKRK